MSSATDGQIDIAGNVYEAPMGVQEVYVTGSVDGDPRALGRKLPQAGTLSIGPLKAKVEAGTHFENGDVIYGKFVARIVDIGQKLSVDKETGVEMESVQHHKAVVLDFVLTEKEEL